MTVNFLFMVVFTTATISCTAFKSVPLRRLHATTHLNSLLKNVDQESEYFAPISFIEKHEIHEINERSNENINFNIINPAIILSVMSLLIPVESATAAGGAYGVFEGKLASMAHPVTMLALFTTSVYSAYLGLQWRRLRGIGEELKEITSQMPKLSTGIAKSPISESLSAFTSEMSTLSKSEGDTSGRLSTLQNDISLLQGAREMDSKIKELSQTRKDLISMDLRSKHYTTGSTLLGVGVTVAILGAFNTYMR